MKKVLVISYYWPPAGGTGVYRILKFVKNLQHHGYQPIVLTAESAVAPLYDQKLLEEIPDDIPVYRSKIWEPGAVKNPQNGSKIQTAKLQDQSKSLKTKFMKWVRLNLFVPDAKIGWIPYATRLGKKIIQEHKPDLIFSTAPPPSTHLVAKKLSQWAGLPWVSDYRDPWTQIYYYDHVKRWSWAENKNLKLEKECLDHAAGLSLVNDQFFPHLDLRDKKQIVIPNGFDRQEFPEDLIEKEVNNQGRFTFRYVGGYKVDQYHPSLFLALERLAQENPNFKAKFKGEFFGYIDPSIQQAMNELCPSLEMDCFGYIPRSEVVEKIADAQLLYLVVGESKLKNCILSTKTFEYLSLHKQMLCLGPPEGGAAKIVESCGCGTMIPLEAEEEIYIELKSIFEAWEKGQRKYSAKPEVIEQYEFKQLTGQLTHFFDQILSSEPA